jgi:hypothetical protein
MSELKNSQKVKKIYKIEYEGFLEISNWIK